MKRIGSAFAVSFAFWLGFAPTTMANGPSPTESAALARLDIDNFGRVNANYYRGSLPRREDFEGLAAAGIKTIVDLTSDDGDPLESSSARAAGLKFFKLPMTTHSAPSRDELANFFAIVDDPANQPVYVHCVGGKHRTGVMTAAYRMTQEGWTADQAFQEMKQYRF